MKYFLVEVKKAFGIYPIKAQIPMREKLVNGVFKDNIKKLRELNAEEMEKYNPVVKYKLDKPEEDGEDTDTGTDVDPLEALEKEELLEIANTELKLNKPSNTGKPKLIAAINEARAEEDGEED